MYTYQDLTDNLSEQYAVNNDKTYVRNAITYINSAGEGFYTLKNNQYEKVKNDSINALDEQHSLIEALNIKFTAVETNIEGMITQLNNGLTVLDNKTDSLIREYGIIEEWLEREEERKRSEDNSSESLDE